MVRCCPTAPAFLVTGGRRTVLPDMAVIGPEAGEAAVDGRLRRPCRAGTYAESGFILASVSICRLYVDDLPGRLPRRRSHRRFGRPRSWRLEETPTVGTTLGIARAWRHSPWADSQPEMPRWTRRHPDFLHEHVRAQPGWNSFRDVHRVGSSLTQRESGASSSRLRLSAIFWKI